MATKPAFRPSKARQGVTSFHLRQYAQATLGSGSLRKVVMLPEGEDENEWLAFNIVDFYNQINLLFGAVSEFCTPITCPEMKATDEFEYLWQDGEKYRKPTKMPACQYVEHLMTMIQKNVDDDQVFASRNGKNSYYITFSLRSKRNLCAKRILIEGVEFAPDFRNLIVQFFKRLARVYAHIYCHHFPVVGALALDKHMNTSFKHFVLFVKEFKLDQGRDYWGPLNELVNSMMATADQ
ncbi:Mitotic exit network component, variant 2 [Orbilia oligospora]|nr:Mitotic exit network component, variant 2 [Orbilia oligospora]